MVNHAHQTAEGVCTTHFMDTQIHTKPKSEAPKAYWADEKLELCDFSMVLGTTPPQNRYQFKAA